MSRLGCYGVFSSISSLKSMMWDCSPFVFFHFPFNRELLLKDELTTVFSTLCFPFYCFLAKAGALRSSSLSDKGY